MISQLEATEGIQCRQSIHSNVRLAWGDWSRLKSGAQVDITMEAFDEGVKPHLGPSTIKRSSPSSLGHN
jgi:hypothetical protein